MHIEKKTKFKNLEPRIAHVKGIKLRIKAVVVSAML